MSTLFPLVVVGIIVFALAIKYITSNKDKLSQRFGLTS